MKFSKVFLIALIATFASVAGATSSHSVRGYTKKNGTYVQPHRQTNPNHTRTDNWSHKGNTNPYTGKRGTKR
jgi:hypothetical protein